MGKRVLITGGAGFIGSHLVDALVNDGFEILVLDNFDPFYLRSIKENNLANSRQAGNFTLIEADIRDREGVCRIFAQWIPELVVHLAAKAGVRPSVQDPRSYFEVNVTGTVNVLDAALHCGVKKVIFASSSSVYGLNEKVPFSESDPVLHPASPYGATKISGEAICRSYSNCFQLPIVALRFFTVYGPRQRPDLAIHKFARMILENEPIPVFGDGFTKRDYTYVADIIAGIRAAMEYTPSGCEVFNLGNDHPVRLIELIHLLEDALGRKARINRLPPQVGDVPQTWADLSRVRALGYAPGIGLKEGIKRFIEWIDAHAGQIFT